MENIVGEIILKVATIKVISIKKWAGFIYKIY